MAKRIKILYTIPNFKTAGSQYVLLSLFNRIDKSRFDPYVCVEKFPETIPSDIPLGRRLVFKFTGNMKKDVMRFCKILKNNNITIVHSWDYKSNYLEPLACRFSGVKYLNTKKNNAWSKKWKLKSLLSNHIAYDNPKMKKRFFNSFLFRNKISFIPHGVDIELFRPLKKIAQETFTIGCIGNIGANKNQLFIIEALKNLPKNVALHLYGNEEKKYRVILDKHIKSYELVDRVHFHGFINNKEVPKIFENIDLFVLASFQEGLPVSILEALACGVPVLSSDSGGGANFVLKKGGGFIFDLDNPKCLVEHLKRLSQNPEEMALLCKEGRKNVITNFSLKKEIAAYENLYVKLKK